MSETTSTTTTPTSAATPSEEEVVQTGNMFTRSKMFKSMVKWAFSICDDDKSGEIGKDELYTGVLLVHLYIAKYAGAAACFPATRATVDKLFDASDADNSGSIDEQEFATILVVTCGSIFSRVLLYFALLLFVSPIGAKGIVAVLAYMVQGTVWFQAIRHAVQDPISKHPFIDNLFDWDTLAEDLIGKVVFFVAFPIVFQAIDDFYQVAAEGNMLKKLEAMKQKIKDEAIKKKTELGAMTDKIKAKKTE
ncbi:expressed unknown protein [Seminavis robusta]|uniref:EF-hand domain-containing protein n=1 Tax=Seminavis robusta TaxID=568900 RepID=A0A9N8H817_9STRA|nr:expressed unknown protein [Seminavis robusta]|eukprot:Sro81_g043360.1 n/a (249) ;mRNA; r:21064-22008